MNKTLTVIGVAFATALSTNIYAQTVDHILCNVIEISLNDEGIAQIDPMDLLKSEIEQEELERFNFSVAKSEFFCGDIGQNKVRLTAVYENGTTLRCEGRVRVNDIIAPVAKCKDVVLQGPTTLQITSDHLDNGSFDNCDMDFQVFQTETTEFESETKSKYLMRVTDSRGNKSECSSNVTVLNTLNDVNVSVTDNHVSDVFNVTREAQLQDGDISTATKEKDLESAIDPSLLSIFPNPVVDEFTFICRDTQKIFSGIIKDLSGNVLKRYSQFGNGDKLSVDGIRKGVYILEIRNKRCLVKKLRIVIQ